MELMQFSSPFATDDNMEEDGVLVVEELSSMAPYKKPLPICKVQHSEVKVTTFGDPAYRSSSQRITTRRVRKPPSPLYQWMSSEYCPSIRRQWHVSIDGEPPISNFKDMNLPEPILKEITATGIAPLTPIQLQALCVSLSGSSMIGVSFPDGIGKSLISVLPSIMVALQQQQVHLRTAPLPNTPFGLIICSSSHNAALTYGVLEHLLSVLKQNGFPELRPYLCDNEHERGFLFDLTQNGGVDIIVAVPALLKFLLTDAMMNFDNCRYLALDDADFLLDLSYEDDIKKLLHCYTSPPQILFFSATYPLRVKTLARRVSNGLIVVNAGRAGTASLKVAQDVEHVKQEEKIFHLDRCLRKRKIPVLIFCGSRVDVDYVHEYLLLKGLKAVAVHGGKSQREIDFAVSSFRLLEARVMVATDAASQALDLPNVEHVINYDMPSEIQHYLHRLGRTGRCGQEGIVTTLISEKESKIKLTALKKLLEEANLGVPHCNSY